MAERVPAVSIVAWVAAAGAVLVPVVGGLARAGYDQRSQFISELGERGAPAGALVSFGGFLPIGLLALVFAVLAARRLRTTPALAVGVALVGAGLAVSYGISGVARCQPGCPADGDPQQLWHYGASVVEFVLAPAGLVVVALAARRRPGWRPVVVLSWIGVVLFGVIGWLLQYEVAPAWRGAQQRLLEAVVWAWVALVGWRLRRPMGRVAPRRRKS